MLKKGMSKQEIEKELEGNGDFVKIDHITRFVKSDVPLDIKKFLYLKLAGIYEKRGMFSDAAKIYENIAILSITFSEKITYYVKETECYIKAGFFDRADESFKKALGCGNTSQKAEISFSIKEFYKKQALVYEREKRRNYAIKIYEKIISMNISETEREEIRRRLLDLYEKSGRVKDYFVLKKSIG